MCMGLSIHETCPTCFNDIDHIIVFDGNTGHDILLDIDYCKTLSKLQASSSKLYQGPCDLLKGCSQSTLTTKDITTKESKRYSTLDCYTLRDKYVNHARGIFGSVHLQSEGR
jgi:hypothetical protein